MRKLKLLMGICALLAGGASTVNAQQTPAADGEYYLYHPQTQKFLSRGSSWGTRSVVDDYGIPFKLEAADGKYRIKYIDNDAYQGDSYWMYADKAVGNANTFLFEETTGGYYIRTQEISGDNNRMYVYLKEDDSKYCVAGNAIMNDNISDEAQTVWQLLSKAERDAIVSNYPAKNKENVILATGINTTAEELVSYLSTNYAAKDMTSSVGTAKFAGNVGSWKWNEVRGQGNQPAYGTNAAEAWQATGSWTQTIENLPEGLYKVTVNGFERSGGFAKCNTLAESGWEIVTSYFQANTEKVQLKSWYSDKEGTNNPNSVTEAATAFNNDKYKNEFYTYVGSDGTLSLTMAKPTHVGDNWLLFNNVTLTFYSDAVSDEEATALIEKAAEYLEKPMLSTLAEAIANAKTTFEASKTIANYNVLQAALDNSETSIESYAYAAEVLDKLTAELANTNVYTAEALENNYTSIKAKFDSRTLTNAEANALVFSNRRGGLWPQIALSAWSVGETAALSGDEVIYINNWSVEGNTDGSGMTTPFVEYWVGDANAVEGRTFTISVTAPEADKQYKMSALVRVRQQNNQTKADDDVTLLVNDGEAINLADGTQTNSVFFYKNVETITTSDSEGKIVAKFIVKEDNHINWLAIKNVKYEEFVPATESEKQALTDAITAAEAYMLGFEAGEYAPYTNVAACEALATAKAIDPATAAGEEVVAATAALTAATWTANTEEVNAVYNGTFGLSTANVTSGADLDVPGWTVASGSIRQVIENGTNGTFPALSETTDQKALFTWGGTYKYGETTGYTMPLKGNTVYQLSFKHAGWNGSNNNFSVNVLNAEGKGMATQVCGKSEFGPQTANCWNTYTIVFATEAAGDYVLSMIPNGNSTFTDIELKKAESQVLEFADGTVPAYAPGTYPTVKISRTLTAGRWATAVYPFAVSGVDKIAVIDSYADNKLSFKSATESEANVPFLMRSESDKSEISLENVAVAAAAVINATAGDATLIGTYATTTVEAGENVKNYVLSQNTIYAVGENAATVSPYRAYIQLAQPSEARTLSFVIDGQDTTGIEGLSAAEGVMSDKVYNLNGQQVEKAQKGLYIVGGKKVVVK